MAATHTLDSQIPLLIRHLENALRAGYNLKQAFAIVARDMSEPTAAGAQRMLDRVASGASFPDALDTWLNEERSRDLDLVVATIHLQFEVGGNLADKLNLLGQIMAKRALAV